MIMSWIFCGIILLSVVFSAFFGLSPATAITEGAQAGITLAISLAGSICLWSGFGALATKLGLTEKLSRILSPLLFRLFPSSKKDPMLRGELSANICANLLGLGNAATPMGIRATKRLVDPVRPDRATPELCRLIVLNTASIQLIPANVAALRGSLGSKTPFDILPAVWVTSLASAALGLLAAVILERIFGHD